MNVESFDIVVTQKGAPQLSHTVPTFELRQIHWNDAGYLTTYDLTYRQVGKAPIEIGLVKIMRPDLQLELFSVPIGPLRELSSDHCALGQSYTFYETLLEIDAEIAARFLQRIRDVVISPSRLRRFSDEALFKNSLMRESRAVRALEDAPQLYNASRSSKGSKLPRRMQARVQLGAAAVEFSVDFRDLTKGVSSRILALVGDNGTGKSAILGLLASSLLAEPATRTGSTKQFGFLQVGGDADPVNFARVITISYGAFDDHALVSATRGREELSRPSKARQKHYYRGLRAWTKDGEARLKSVAEIEAELWEALTSIQDERRYEAFKRAIELLQMATEFPKEVIDELLARNPKRVALAHLSSGQTIVLNVLVSLIAYLEPGSLVLIDEPEVHLHPPLLSALMRGIAASLREFESVAIVATHSSVVVQELPSRNVRVLRRIDRVTVATPPDIETYGESLGIIDRSVFGLAGQDSDFLKVLRDIDVSRGLASATKQLGIPLSNQAMALLLQLGEDR